MVGAVSIRSGVRRTTNSLQLCMQRTTSAVAATAAARVVYSRRRTVDAAPGSVGRSVADYSVDGLGGRNDSSILHAAGGDNKSAPAVIIYSR